MSDRALTNLAAARHALSECRTVMQAKRVMEQANAARDLLERVKASEDAVNEAVEVRLLAQKQMGEFLAETPKNEGAKGSIVTGSSRVPVKDKTPTLAEMGITKKESSIAQKLAAMPEEEFQRRIEAGKANGKLTIAAVVNPPAQEVVYDASTDEEQVEVLAPEKPSRKRRDDYKLDAGMFIFRTARDQMLMIADTDIEFIEAHQAMIDFCNARIKTHNNR